MYQYPTLHRPVPMNTKVILPKEWLGYEASGTVVGIASLHVVFQYIVLLDSPHQDSDYGEIRAVTVGGSQLMDHMRKHVWSFALDHERGEYLKEMNEKHGKQGSLSL